MKRITFTSGLRRVAFAQLPLAGVALVLSLSPASAAPTAKAEPVPAVAQAGKIEIPKSEFIIPSAPGEGRDPFFPDSTRVSLTQKPVTDKAGTKAPAPALFTLKAITASGGRRVASINNRPFEAGEEGDIAFGSSRVRVRCVEVREDSVIIDVDGQTQELRLRPKR